MDSFTIDETFSLAIAHKTKGCHRVVIELFDNFSFCVRLELPISKIAAVYSTKTPRKLGLRCLHFGDRPSWPKSIQPSKPCFVPLDLLPKVNFMTVLSKKLLSAYSTMSLDWNFSGLWGGL